MPGSQVQLQVYDDMPHVLTVFTFAKAVRTSVINRPNIFLTYAHLPLQAAYAYRAIAQFAQHATTHSAEDLFVHPFPDSKGSEHQAHVNNNEGEHGRGLCCIGSTGWRNSSSRSKHAKPTAEEGPGRESSVAESRSNSEQTAVGPVAISAAEVEPESQDGEVTSVRNKGGDVEVSLL